MPAPAPWHTESSRTILDLKPWFSVVEDTVRLPSGKVVNDYYRIEAPDYVIISAQRDDGCILLERHFKQCLGRVILTSPAGSVDEGETPLEAAQRELLEETGYQAREWQKLGAFTVDGTRGICTAHLFSANAITKVAAPVQDEMEEMEIVFLEIAAILLAIQDNSICLLPDIALLFLAMSPQHKLNHLTKSPNNAP